ncbi:MAG: hypothetical protein QM718_11640 [Steroidobacteraceae bacterium]
MSESERHDPATAGDTPLERRARQLLGASIADLDGRTRSRLTQARHAALAVRRRTVLPGWLPQGWRAPAGASAAAVLVGLVVFNLHHGAAPSASSSANAEDLELLADADALELSDTADYDFYEWAVAQASEDNAGGAPAAAGPVQGT